MKKELIESLLNDMFESALCTSTIMQIREGDLMCNSGTVYVKTLANKLYFLCMSPYEDKDRNDIHGNTRNLIAKEFINKYSYTDIKNAYLKKEEEQNKHIMLEENNKYKLEELLPIMEKFKDLNMNKYDNNISIKFNGTHKYHINICDTIEIYNNNDYVNYILRYNYENTILSKEELLNTLDKVYNEYKEKHDIKMMEKKKKLEELNKQIKLEKLIYNLYEESKDKYIIIKTSKNSYTAFHNNLKYAVGKNKMGKFYNTDSVKFEKFITSKNIDNLMYAISTHTDIDNVDSWHSFII